MPSPPLGHRRVNKLEHELSLLVSVQEQVKISFEEVYDRINWDQVFDLCREKLGNSESHGLCPFLRIAIAALTSFTGSISHITILFSEWRTPE